jgi:hypothetical protein
MSQEQADEIKEVALALYGIFAQRLGHSHWDWQPVAVTALEAAEVFSKVFNERYAPQSGVPVPTPQPVPP